MQGERLPPEIQACAKKLNPTQPSALSRST